MNLPLGIINLWLIARCLKETDLIKGSSLDISGIMLSMIGFFTLLLALDQSSSKGWSDPEIVFLLLTGGVSLVAFTINELRVSDPILDLRLYAKPVFSITSLVNWVLQGGLNGAVFLEPILIQNVLGQTALTSGLITFPAAIAISVMMPISGWIFDHFGERKIAIIGVAITAWTTYMMHTFSPMTAFSVMTIWMTIRGAGIGLCMMPLTTACLNAAPESLVGRASSALEVTNQVFSSLGIAALATIMQNREAFHYAQLASSINGSGPAYYQLQSILHGMAVRLGAGAGAVQTLNTSVLYGLVSTLSAVQAIDDCFIVAAAGCAIGLVACFFLKDKKLTVNSN